MSSFAYETRASAAAVEGSWAQAARTKLPIEGSRMASEFTQYPWEATPDVEELPFSVRTGSTAPRGVTIVAESHKQVQRVTRQYVERIAPRLPDTVRDSFLRGAGMFDFESPADLDDHLG